MKISEIEIGEEYVTTSWRMNNAHVRALEIVKPKGSTQREVKVEFVERFDNRRGYTSKTTWEPGETTTFAPRDLEPWGPYFEREQTMRKNLGECTVIRERLRKEAHLPALNDDNRGHSRRVTVTLSVEEWAEWLNGYRVHPGCPQEVATGAAQASDGHSGND